MQHWTAFFVFEMQQSPTDNQRVVHLCKLFVCHLLWKYCKLYASACSINKTIWDQRVLILIPTQLGIMSPKLILKSCIWISKRAVIGSQVKIGWQTWPTARVKNPVMFLKGPKAWWLFPKENCFVQCSLVGSYEFKYSCALSVLEATALWQLNQHK